MTPLADDAAPALLPPVVRAHDVAWRILTTLGCISEMKLTRLVYIAQARHLAMTQRPLFRTVVEAWANGPALPALHRIIQHGDRGTLDARWLEAAMARRRQGLLPLPSDHADRVDQTLAIYAGFSGFHLADLVQADLPWRVARGDTLPGLPCRARIPHPLLARTGL